MGLLPDSGPVQLAVTLVGSPPITHIDSAPRAIPPSVMTHFEPVSSVEGIMIGFRVSRGVCAALVVAVAGRVATVVAGALVVGTVVTAGSVVGGVVVVELSAVVDVGAGASDVGALTVLVACRSPWPQPDNIVTSATAPTENRRSERSSVT
jgi:hypothetical protein